VAVCVLQLIYYQRRNLHVPVSFDRYVILMRV